MRELARVANELGKKIYDWTIVQGIARYRASIDAATEGKKGTKDPIIALREVLSISEPSIIVFRDFHNFISDSSVKRVLRDLATILRSSLSTVVLLSPVLRIPEEMEKDITIVDFPLPDRADLTALLQQIARDIQDNPSLRVDMDERSLEAMLDAAIGLTLNEAENVFAKTLVLRSRLGAAEAPLIYGEKKQIVRKSGLLEYIEVEDTLGNVGGLDVLKGWIQKRRSAMEPRAREFGLPPPRGLLLVGVQGCGKSLAAKAIANDLSFPLLRMDVGRLFAKMVGETEFNIRRALQIAEAVAPVVLWIDEIEKGSERRAQRRLERRRHHQPRVRHHRDMAAGEEAPGVRRRHCERDRGPAAGDPAQGRFDEIFFVDLPAEPERAEIFAHSPRQARTRSAEVRSRTGRRHQRRLLRCGDRAGGR